MRGKKSIFITMLTSVILYSAMLVADTPAGDEILTINAAVNPGKATVGDILQYRVTIAGKDLKGVDIILPEKRVFYPEVKAEKDARGKAKDGEKGEEDPAQYVPLYMIHSAKKEDSSDDRTAYIAVVLSLSYFRPGTYGLPEIEITGKDKIKVGYEIPTIEIGEVNKEAQLQEIEPPLDLGGNYYRLIMLIAGVIVLTLLAVFGYRYWKKRREAMAVPEPEIDPLEAFRKEVDDLGGRALIVNGKVEEYIVGISMIFRRYLSRLFSFDATEMTSEEISSRMKKMSRRYGTAPLHDEIMERFYLWDLSKFAEFTPSEAVLLESHEKTLRLAENLRRATGHVES